MATFSGFDRPNHTQTPIDFFDNVLPNVKYFSELKVLLVIIRKTYGWHKHEDRISLAQLVELTGMKRQVVVDGIKYALEDGYIERRAEGQNFYYRLKVVSPGDPQKKLERKLKKEDEGKAANAVSPPPPKQTSFEQELGLKLPPKEPIPPEKDSGRSSEDSPKPKRKSGAAGAVSPAAEKTLKRTADLFGREPATL